MKAMKKEGGDGEILSPRVKMSSVDDATASSPSPGSSQTPKSTPGKGKKRKQIHELGADADDDDEALTSSVSKRSKRGPKSASPVKKDEEHVIGTEIGGDNVKHEPED